MNKMIYGGDRRIERLNYIKSLSKEKFLKEDFGDESIYNSLQNSKRGFITISKVGDPSKGESGWTEAFGEGISCYISNTDRWYSTSVIQKIRWEDKEFDTLNSTYKFTFEEYDTDKS